MDTWLLDNLACPRHNLKLTLDGDHLICGEGDRFFIADGVPILLYDDGNPTHGFITRTLEQAARIEAGEPMNDVVEFVPESTDGIDQYVRRYIPFTCGTLYHAIKDKMSRYPFPVLRLPESKGKRLLDIGCGWGRWTIAAELKGYKAVGIDPNLDAILAARRVARQLGVDANFIVADTLSLPFLQSTFDVTFSFSLLQHFRKSNVKKALPEISRVTKDEGRILIQMPNKHGLRCLYQQIKRGFKDGEEGTDVFYWTAGELKSVFNEQLGPSKLTADCFLGLNIQGTDVDIMPWTHKIVIRTSEMLRKISEFATPMVHIADSLYVSSINRKREHPAK
ncbi:hypothetical protein BH10ACI3_BH10ACI3_26710 [soil metagenome]